MKLSAYVITLNEEKRIGKTLKALTKVADEIIVVDSGSTDKTKEIVEKFNCNFIYHKWVSYCDQKHFAQEKCKNDFVIMVDADEVLSEKLIKEINDIKKNGFKSDAYNIKIVDMSPNSEKPNVFAKKFNVIRLYNKKIANLPDNLMNKDRVNVSRCKNIEQLKNPILHYSFLSIFDAVQKYNIHSEELVKTAIKNKKHYSTFRLIFELPRQFLKYYFAHRLFLYGKFGFTQAMILSYFRFLKVAKVIEYYDSRKK